MKLNKMDLKVLYWIYAGKRINKYNRRTNPINKSLTKLNFYKFIYFNSETLYAGGTLRGMWWCHKNNIKSRLCLEEWNWYAEMQKSPLSEI